MTKSRILGLGMIACVALFLVEIIWGGATGATRAEGHDSERIETQAVLHFWTFNTLEPDTLASAWLLSALYEPHVELHFVPRGTKGQGVPFDMPLVELSRTYNQSSFTVIADRCGVDRNSLDPLLGLIDEIELSGWSSEPSAAAKTLEGQLRAIIERNSDPHRALQESAEILGRLGSPTCTDPNRKWN